MRHVIFVLGAHRSGTSAIARSLRCLGFQLGPRAEWSAPDNEKGFWEDQDVLVVDDYLLRRAGSAWDDPVPVDFGTPEIPRVNAAPFIVSLLEQRLAEFPLFAIKEPRMCRLLPVWRNCLAQIDCEVSIVHAIRHPSAVAASLKSRNDIPIERGLVLWLEYTRRARLDVDPRWPSVTVQYEQMLTYPMAELARMGEKLGFPLDTAETNEFLDGFLDGGLQHEKASDAPLPPEVAAEWKIVVKEAMT